MDQTSRRRASWPAWCSKPDDLDYEKVGELVLVQLGVYENINSGVPRLCIPPWHVQDGPQGLAYGDTNVTQLPAPLGIAATFDTAMARAYGEVQGTEASGQGYRRVQGPDLNIDRVPESGRAYEGYGEDPVPGVGHGGGQHRGHPVDRDHGHGQALRRLQPGDRPWACSNDVVSQRALQELYLPPFKAAVTQAHVDSVMCAYPRLNGTFQCQDPSCSAC
jgi:beta-glucosidase